LQMFQMSAAMAGQFVAVAQQMTELVEKLGPNPLREVDAFRGGGIQVIGSDELTGGEL
jgi:hypothetical protein